MVKKQKPLSVCQLRYGLKKTVLLRKEDLSSKGRVIEQIYSLARIFLYFPIITKNVCTVVVLVILLGYHCCIHIVCYIDAIYSKNGAKDVPFIDF